jgi:hypothetical protein
VWVVDPVLGSANAVSKCHIISYCYLVIDRLAQRCRGNLCRILTCAAPVGAS